MFNYYQHQTLQLPNIEEEHEHRAEDQAGAKAETWL